MVVGQERHYRGKLVYPPWLSKCLNKIRFLAELTDSAVERALFIDGKFTSGLYPLTVETKGLSAV
jgi:hypothetical protein